MAGLPCDVCQEETLVIPTGQPGLDGEGRTVYRRYRVCANPRCERFELRRSSLEFFLALETEERVDTRQLRARLSAATPGESQPSLFES